MIYLCTRQIIRFVFLLAVVLPFTQVFAMAGGAPDLEVGNRLSAEQISRINGLQSIKIEGMRFRVIPGQADAAETYLLNSRGIVGVSRHEVTVSGASEAEVKAQVSREGPSPVSINHLESTNITVLTYADFDQTLRGWEALKKHLPDSTINLSLRFDKKRTR